MYSRSLAVVVAAGLVLAVGCQDEVGTEVSRPSGENPPQIDLPEADPLEQWEPSEDDLAQIKLLKDDSVNVRLAAFNGLVEGGKAGVPVLIQLLGDQNTQTRVSAAHYLAQIGSDARRAVPALAKALGDRDPEVRYYAADALHDIGRLAKPAVPALIKSLQDKNSRVRYTAASALGRIGRDARTAIPALGVALKDSEPYVRIYAAESLWKLSGQTESILPVLRASLNESCTLAAIELLKRIGPEAKSAVPELILALKNENWTTATYSCFIRIAAVETLAPFGSDAVPQLIIRREAPTHLDRQALAVFPRTSAATTGLSLSRRAFAAG